MTGLSFAVLALAVYRLTLLATADRVTAAPRARLIDRFSAREHELVREKVREDPGFLGGRVWLECECRCGFRVVAADPQSAMEVLSEFNGHVYAPENRGKAHPYLLDLIDCEWCVSVWIAVPAAAAWYWWGDGWGWWVLMGGLAASGVTGFLSRYAKPS